MHIIEKVESLSLQFCTEDQMKEIAPADFLIHELTNDSERCEYFRQSLLQMFSKHQYLI